MSCCWQRFYRHLELKSKDPDAAVPPLDGTLQKITEPDPDLFSRNKSVIDTFQRRFELKENPKVVVFLSSRTLYLISDTFISCKPYLTQEFFNMI